MLIARARAPDFAESLGLGVILQRLGPAALHAADPPVHMQLHDHLFP